MQAWGELSSAAGGGQRLQPSGFVLLGLTIIRRALTAPQKTLNRYLQVFPYRSNYPCESRPVRQHRQARHAAVRTAAVPGGGASKTNTRRFRRRRLAKRALVRNRITPRWGEEGCGLKRGGFKRAGADFPPLGKRGDCHEDCSLRLIGHSAS
jgi:hypothetical protein